MSNKFSFSILLLIIILSSGIISNAQESTKKVTTITGDMIEDNLLEGVKSDNEGLKISSAYYLGENKSEAAVIPLMGILKSEKSSEQAKIMAALSLFKIGDQRGIYAIKGAIEYEENNAVKKMCKIFYDMHLQQQKVKKGN